MMLYMYAYIFSYIDMEGTYVTGSVSSSDVSTDTYIHTHVNEALMSVLCRCIHV